MDMELLGTAGGRSGLRSALQAAESQKHPPTRTINRQQDCFTTHPIGDIAFGSKGPRAAYRDTQSITAEVFLARE
jgi:hypothetical protein